MPKFMVEPAPKHRFRPVEWNWTIKDQMQPADFNAASIPADQSPGLAALILLVIYWVPTNKRAVRVGVTI
ncbi:MAG TPA: hypothetical protein VHV32_05365 [Candidatus Angelobacter sp.]|nr:hypothetical protein [Candidatus Angelobacter sp.]